MSKDPHGTNLDTRSQATAVKTQKEDSDRPTPNSPESYAVDTIDKLYAAVNNPNLAGTIIVLEEGIYVLSPMFDHGGRLELQPGMKLMGGPGDPARVTIDASNLPDAVFEIPVNRGNRLGVIRVGCGANAVERLTIKGHNRAIACIAADLDTDSTGRKYTSPSIRIADVVCDNTATPNSRGIDLRSFGKWQAGRTIFAEIERCTLRGGMQGIRLANFFGADGAKIRAMLKSNVCSGNSLGCIITNNRTNFGTINVNSTNDKFTGNALGCHVAGAIVQDPTVPDFTPANMNVTTFDAQGSEFTNNNWRLPATGILVTGADTPDCPGTASDNRVEMHLTACTISGNTSADFRAFGARNTGTLMPGISGKRNTVNIELQDDGSVNVSATDCVPLEETPTDPVRTNLVTVTRSIIL